jgi:hypothetical protein
VSDRLDVAIEAESKLATATSQITKYREKIEEVDNTQSFCAFVFPELIAFCLSSPTFKHNFRRNKKPELGMSKSGFVFFFT